MFLICSVVRKKHPMIESPNYNIILYKIIISVYSIKLWDSRCGGDSWHLLGRNPFEMHCFFLCSSYNLYSVSLMLMFHFNRTHPLLQEHQNAVSLSVQIQFLLAINYVYLFSCFYFIFLPFPHQKICIRKYSLLKAIFQNLKEISLLLYFSIAV